MLKHAKWALLWVGLIIVPLAKADPVIFDLSPAGVGPYSAGMYAASNRFITQEFYTAVSFPQGATVTGMSIYTLANRGIPANEPLVVDIYPSDASGNLTGSSINTMFVNATALDTQGAVDGLNDIRVYAPFTAPVVMAPGETLWFSMSGNNNDPAIYLMNNPGAPFRDVFQFGPGYTGTIPGNVAAIQLYGAAVPEPGSLAMLGVAVLGGLMRKRGDAHA